MDTDAEKLAVAQEMIDAWNRLDWDRVIDLFAEDGALHSMMEAEATVGRAAIRRRLDALCEGASEVRIEVANAGVVNGAVFLERVDNFVIRGNAGAMPVVGVIEIEDGLVTMWREYYDRATLLRGLALERDFVHDL
jgi:limonene-1,2-epoxide hydrolase